MHGAAGDAGQVIDFLAGSAHPARLLNDSQPLHALQKLHPLDGQDLRVQALAEHREGMQFQGTNGALGRGICPTRAADLDPLPCEGFKGTAGSLQLGSLAGLLGGERVLAIGGIGAQLGCLLPGQ
ncbi:hypothetical protein D3C81_1770470 [compost metagenome]